MSEIQKHNRKEKFYDKKPPTLLFVFRGRISDKFVYTLSKFYVNIYTNLSEIWPLTSKKQISMMERFKTWCHDIS